jgi:heterodisulfide reductase subunit A-like polyferredoxin
LGEDEITVNEDELLSDENGNYAYLTLGGILYTPSYLELIDHSRCEKCEGCLELCETRGLDELGRVIPEVPEICNGCGHCGNICPARSIVAKPIPLEEMKKRLRRYKSSKAGKE